jgi:hypothetical protein
MRTPVTVLVTYRPKKGREKMFSRLLHRHWPALKQAGLVARTRARLWQATDKKTGRTYFVETFSWKDEKASEKAHASPDVLAIWNPMGPMLESMDIAVIRPLQL